MSKHRSLAEALDPVKQAFIRGEMPDEKPKPKKLTGAKPTEAVKVAPPKDTESKQEPQPAQKERKPREKGRQNAPTPAPHKLTHAVVPVTTRFRQDTAEALRRASLERKLEGESPSTQQEIVEIAVASWLKAKGYLDAAPKDSV